MAYGGLLFVAACLAWCIVVKSHGDKNSATVCEDKKKTISCPESHTSIDVTFAAYGRTSTSVCIHTHLPHSRTDCVRNDNTVLDIVKNKCDGKKNCELEAKNGVFGDTCYGTYKYLEVTFECKSEQELGADSEELGAEYIGCYKDDWGRDLPNVFIKDYSGNTPKKCISQCEKKGFVYAAVQYSWACFCGNSYGKYGSISESRCQMACSGNKALKCGGGWANAIYKISYPEPQSEAVVFSAELTTDLPRMNEPTKVAFDHVFTNAGNGYDVTSGIFTAPKAGYYSISAAMLSWYDSRFFVMLNGKGVQYIASLGRWQADSATVNLKLAEDDKVWIEAIGVIYGSKHCVYPKKFGDEYKCYPSSFSGFLIKEE